MLVGDARVRGDEASTSVSHLVDDLYSANLSTATQAKEKVLTMARQSRTNRNEIIRNLLAVFDDPRTEQVGYSSAWYASAELLGDLKAEEAINALVRHLDYTNGVAGLSLSHFPAAKALTKIGRPAVPALSVALADPRPSMRENAARALGEIGGPEAAEVLKNAVKSEKDSDVRFYIAKALEAATKYVSGD